MAASRASEPIAIARRARVSPVVFVTMAVGLFGLWLATLLGGLHITRDVDDFATAGMAAAAAISCAVAGGHHLGGARRFWRLLAAAMAAWTIGEAVWAYYDLVLGRHVPVPSYADVGYLGAIPLAIAALFSHPHNRGNREVRLRATLDGFVLATSLLFLRWSFILGAVWSRSDLSGAARLVTLAYPFGDVVVVFLLIRALRSLEGPDRIAFSWILVGLLAMSLSDSGYTYLSAVRGYHSGSLIDIGWFAGYLAVAVGAWHGRRPQRPPRRVAAPSTSLALLTPFVPVLLALSVFTVKAQLGSPIDHLSLVLAGTLTVSVLLRQAIAVLYPPPRLAPEPAVVGFDDQDRTS